MEGVINMSDLVLKFPSGVVVDFRSFPVKAFAPDGKPAPEGSTDGILEDLDEAVKLSPEEIAAFNNPSQN